MMSISSAGESHRDVTTSIRHRARARWFAGALLAASSCAASLVLLPATAQAQQHGTATLSATSARPARSSTPSLTIAAFCAHFPVSTISSMVGAKEALLEAVISKGSYECIFMPTNTSGWEVIISMKPGIPAAELATLAAAEARVAAESGKGAKLIFTSLPSIGKTAFSWTYAESVNGGQIVGVADNKGTTGYGTAMGRGATTFGKASAHVPVLERLLKMDMAA